MRGKSDENEAAVVVVYLSSCSHLAQLFSNFFISLKILSIFFFCNFLTIFIFIFLIVFLIFLTLLL